MLNWQLCSKTMHSRRKVALLKLLLEEQGAPSLAKKTSIRYNHVVSLLHEMNDDELVCCVNNEVQKGKRYRLTKAGLEMVHYFLSEEV